MSEELDATSHAFPSIYERATPRTIRLQAELLRKYPDPLDESNKLLYYMEAAETYGQECKRMEQELETVRDAHMANCLAADTLRTEIRELRETTVSETAPKTRLLSINNIERFHAGDEKLEPDPDGPWVRFEDAAAISNRLASAASTTLPKIDPEALRLAYEFDDDPDKRAQVKVMIAHHIGPQTADLIDEAVKVSRELIRIAEGK